MELTDYFSPKRTAISIHRAKDFLESRKYYHDRHVLGIVADDPSPSMTVGMMLDSAWSAFDIEEIDRLYAIKPVDGDKRIAVRPSDMEKAKGMAANLLASGLTSFYEGKKNESQVPLFGKLGKAEVCCLPDRVTFDGKTAYLDELKSSAASRMKNAGAWWWACKDSWYLEQLALQRYLVQKTYKIKKVITRMIVVSSTETAGRYPIKIWEVPPELLKEPLARFKAVAEDIRKCKDFTDPILTWKDAERLKRPGGDDVIWD